jgi:type II secretory pathway predicted ATPase ExeA
MYMYTDYWGLKKPPFDNVPDPSMYVESHLSVENTVAETLFAIEEGNECLTVIVGDVGLGKTLSLRMILDSLDLEKYKIAFVTNPDMSFVQLLREIIGQLTGKECEVKGKIELLEVFNKLLFETADEGKKVLIFIDEANAISPANLESLRLLTNMQDDDRNLFTIVLAGQLEFAKRLEHPRRANLFQRIGTYNKIEKMDSKDLVRQYVETRLKLAGATREIFTDDAINWLWEFSEHGVPRLINKIAKLCLKAGETNNFNVIRGEIVQQIGDRFDKMAGPAVQKRRAKEMAAPQAPKREVVKATPEKQEPIKAEAVEKERATAFQPPLPPPPPPPPPPPVEAVPEIAVAPPKVEPAPKPEIPKEKPVVKTIEEEELEEEPEEPVVEKIAPPPLPPPPPVEAAPEIAVTSPKVEPTPKPEIPKEKPVVEKIEEEELEEEPEEPVVEKAAPPSPPPLPPPPVEAAPEPKVAPRLVETKMPLPEIPKEKPAPPSPPRIETTPQPAKAIVHPPTEGFLEAEEDKDTITIAGCKIKIEIPPHIMEQSRSANTEQRRKIAGVLAAQTLEKNPQLTASHTVDPVSVWSDILNVIMKKFE